MGLNLKERRRPLQGAVEDYQARAWRHATLVVLCGHAIGAETGLVEWYGGKKGQRPKGGKRALIAVMRKLALGLYVMGVGTDPSDARQLFSPIVGKRSRRGVRQAKKEEKKQRQKV